jgi:2-amino-4-hydroxy-6-hydroxymethyldihydropteridine diphosphokinase
MKTVYLSLGSNLGDRQANIETALRLIENAGIAIVQRSSLYETEPRDVLDQPWFINIVVKAETALFPRQLLARLQRVELLMGRKRLIAKGPRTIDIDILLYGRIVMDTAQLTIPHPRMMERRFVLEPLVEMDPDVREPVSHTKIADALASLSMQRIKRL